MCYFLTLVDGLECYFLRSFISNTFGVASELDKIVRTDHKNLFDTVHSTILTTEKTVWLHVGKKHLLGQKGLLIQSNMQTCWQRIFHKKVPFLVNIERYPKFLEYTLVFVYSTFWLSIQTRSTAIIVCFVICVINSPWLR